MKDTMDKTANKIRLLMNGFLRLFSLTFLLISTDLFAQSRQQDKPTHELGLPPLTLVAENDEFNEIDEAGSSTEELEKKLKDRKKRKGKSHRKTEKHLESEGDEQPSSDEQPPPERKKKKKAKKESQPEREGEFDPFSSIDSEEEEETDSADPDAGSEDEDFNPFERDFKRRLILSPKSMAVAITLSIFPGMGLGNFYADDNYMGYYALCSDILGIGVTALGLALAITDPNVYFGDPYITQAEVLFFSGTGVYIIAKVFAIVTASNAVIAYNERHKMKLKRLNEVSSNKFRIIPGLSTDGGYLALQLHF